MDEFVRVIEAGKIGWAPDGDEAFDDGSHVLQFDIGDVVRLIGFVGTEAGFDARTLRDVRIDAAQFYGILQEWHKLFEQDWKQAIEAGNVGVDDDDHGCSAR